jgi:DNA-binding NtrC family response regulator
MPSDREKRSKDDETGLLFTDGGSGALVLRRFKLKIVGPNGNEREETLERGTLFLGAHPDNDVIIEDKAVSRYHMEIALVEGGLLVKDRKSKNGTFLNGAKVDQGVATDGSKITIGSTNILVASADEKVEVKPSSAPAFGHLIGSSDAMRTLFTLLAKVAKSDATVLVEGETGTGKELVGRAIHDHSTRAKGPFIVVDCGAVAPELVESELFGHEKGSFTGAIATRRGAFEEADGGTIVLDEIGELPPEIQPKLLRVLEAREVKRVGENKQRKVDVRVVAATNRDLAAEVEKGTFRKDLYYRLAVVKVRVPSLRERKDDVTFLIDHFLKHMGRTPDAVSPSLRERLLAHSWPGNVRELRNAVERAAALSGGIDDENQVFTGHGFTTRAVGALLSNGNPARWRGLAFKDAKGQIVEAFEREYLADLLQRHAGNISAAAREAKIDRNYIHRLVKKYNLEIPR